MNEPTADEAKTVIYQLLEGVASAACALGYGEDIEVSCVVSAKGWGGRHHWVFHTRTQKEEPGAPTPGPKQEATVE